jgi:hypothetical protein
MNTSKQNKEDVWSKIEKEKRIDSLIRGVCYISWMTTFILFLTYAIIIVFEFYGLPTDVLTGDFAGNRPHLSSFVSEMVGLTLAFGAVGSLSFGIAVISAIGIFVRMRTSSLKEMRIRLETLEEILLSERE